MDHRVQLALIWSRFFSDQTIFYDDRSCLKCLSLDTKSDFFYCVMKNTNCMYCNIILLLVVLYILQPCKHLQLRVKIHTRSNYLPVTGIKEESLFIGCLRNNNFRKMAKLSAFYMYSVLDTNIISTNCPPKLSC